VFPAHAFSVRFASSSHTACPGCVHAESAPATAPASGRGSGLTATAAQASLEEGTRWAVCCFFLGSPSKTWRAWSRAFVRMSTAQLCHLYSLSCPTHVCLFSLPALRMPRIRVAVRKRPLNRKERARGEADIAYMDERASTAIIAEPKLEARSAQPSPEGWRLVAFSAT